MIFSTSAELCNHHHHPVSECPCHPNKSPRACVQFTPTPARAPGNRLHTHRATRHAVRCACSVTWHKLARSPAPRAAQRSLPSRWGTVPAAWWHAICLSIRWPCSSPRESPTEGHGEAQSKVHSSRGLAAASRECTCPPGCPSGTGRRVVPRLFRAAGSGRRPSVSRGLRLCHSDLCLCHRHTVSPLCVFTTVVF